MAPRDNVRDRRTVVSRVPRSLHMQTVMHHRHEFIRNSLRNSEPMKVDMYNVRQTTVELPSATEKTCSSNAAFKRCCSLSVIAFGAPANSSRYSSRYGT